MSTRPLVLGCALLSAAALGACATRDLHPSTDAGTRWTGTLDPIHRNVDILFLIDDSANMALAQNNLIRNFPALMTALQADPAGLPDIHIAVVSPDMGAGDGSIAGCDAVGGKNGIFQYTARGACTATSLAPGATYISNVAGSPNYAGNIEDVFGCIAALGESGCRFGHQLGAVTRALGVDARPSPIENRGFLRQEAALAIVMLTNEDDCSASPGVPLFDTFSNPNMASQLGPPVGFRCNEFGHLCSRTGDTGFPNRNAPNLNVNATVTYDQCTSNDHDQYLLSTNHTASWIKALKADPAKVVVASIQGSPAPYVVHWTQPSAPDSSCGAASCPWPEITHACTATDGSYGDPGVRTAQFAREFGDNGLVLSVCDGSFAPGLQRVGMAINRVLGPPCIPGPIGLNAQGQPDCEVTRTRLSVGDSLPSCVAVGGQPPCWRLEAAAGCAGEVLTVSLEPDAVNAAYTTVSYSCAK